jgi:mannose-6-phosphate isomerase-like protein (cupin superfamily)
MGKVREYINWFDTGVGERFEVTRDEELLETQAQGGRGIVKVSPFEDYLHRPHTAEHPGKPPTVFENEDLRIEVINLDGPQGAWHRGCDQDELVIQVAGAGFVITEQGTVEVFPGDMALVPRGVSHTNNSRDGEKRVIIYTRKPLRLVEPPPRPESAVEATGKSKTNGSARANGRAKTNGQATGARATGHKRAAGR